MNAAAHELRTPLTPVRVQLHLLRQGQRGPLTDEQRWSLEVIDRNVERLHSLVQDFLEVARLQSGRFPIEMRPIALADVVKEAAESFHHPAERAGLTLTYETDASLTVLADPRRLVQVLFNLIGNAIKFTPEGGTIHVSCVRGGGHGVVSVRDTGIGFKPEDQAKLFVAFSQLTSDARGFATGAGLGLYICKNIVELHGGRIAAQSDGPDRGSEFTFNVPLARPGEDAKPVVSSAEPDATARRDFDERIRKLV